MNKNEYKVNTYVLIKNGEIYEIDEEGCVKKAKYGTKRRNRKNFLFLNVSIGKKQTF